MTSRSTTSSGNRRRLGKGLGSLISSPARVEAAAAVADGAPAAASPGSGGPAGLPLTSIRPNPTQPRKDFDEPALEALAASIRTAGVMQPVVVRRADDGQYELVAGERRWRAAQRAGLETIPAIIRTADDKQSAELSLIENLQREDLNAIERARAFRRLIDDFDLKHQEVGNIVGMDRSTVTNHLRLLELEDQVQDLVRMGLIGLGHARSLLALPGEPDRRRLALRIAREGWSVRTTEREVAKVNRRGEADTGEPEISPRAPSPRRAHLADMERRLSDHLSTKVGIRPGKKKGSGTLVIDFYDSVQFEGLMDRLGFTVDEIS